MARSQVSQNSSGQQLRQLMPCSLRPEAVDVRDLYVLLQTLQRCRALMSMLSEVEDLTFFHQPERLMRTVQNL